MFITVKQFSKQLQKLRKFSYLFVFYFTSIYLYYLVTTMLTRAAVQIMSFTQYVLHRQPKTSTGNLNQTVGSTVLIKIDQINLTLSWLITALFTLAAFFTNIGRLQFSKSVLRIVLQRSDCDDTTSINCLLGVSLCSNIIT